MGLEAREDDYIELEEQRALVYLPINSVEVKLRIKVYLDGEIVNVSRTLDLEELREAFDDGATYELTEKGKEYYSALSKELKE